MRDVLVVEDDRVVLAAMTRLCRAEGLTVGEVDSVAGALAALTEADYRLAVVDLMLPGRSGLELLETLVASDSATPVVMISGYATSENALQALQRGAFDFLPKPFDVAELLGVVRRALRFGERHPGGAEEVAAAERRHFLGRHSWAALDAEGTATVGAAENFRGVLGDARRIALPVAGDHAVQGLKLARVEGAEEAHRIWSPVSGLVVATNTELTGSVDLIDSAPFSAGWLARIVPTDWENEVMALQSRPAGRDAATGG